MDVKVVSIDNHLEVKSAYNSEFVSAAHRLGGKYQNDVWIFDKRDEAAVREACYRCYGDDGIRLYQCDVRITAPDGLSSSERGPIILFGRTVARAFGRDSGARTGDGVIIEQGCFYSGGSARAWLTRAQKETVFIMRDVSAILVAEYKKDNLNIEIISENKLTRVEDELRPLADLAAEVARLKDERDRLNARIASLDAIIHEHTTHD